MNPSFLTGRRLYLIDYFFLAVPPSNNDISGMLAEFLQGGDRTYCRLRITTENEFDIGISCQGRPDDRCRVHRRVVVHDRFYQLHLCPELGLKPLATIVLIFCSDLTKHYEGFGCGFDSIWKICQGLSCYSLRALDLVGRS